MKRLYFLFFLILVLASCSKNGITENKDLASDITTKISDIEEIYPLITRAGFSPSKKYILDVASSSLNISNSDEGEAVLKLDYEWRYGKQHINMGVVLNDIPLSLSENGNVTISAQNIAGTVSYAQGWSYTVETVFSIEAVFPEDLENAHLDIEGDEICLEINGFSREQVEKTGTWAIIDWIYYDKERFVNSLDKQITIDLGEYKAVSKDLKEYELAPFSLGPGEAKEIDFITDLVYDREGYYVGLPKEISVEYDGSIYLIENETLIPRVEKEGWPYPVPVYEIEREYYHTIDDSGFLSMTYFPIYIYRISPEILGL